MTAFADTSALYALLVGTDEAHTAVRAAFERLAGEAATIWTTSFVLVETMALLQHRIGLLAAQDFDEHVLPLLRVRWVDPHLYRLGAARLWREDRRHLSLVDAVSFEFMRLEAIPTALAVDPHFAAAGFKILPAGG